jgi:DNA polymerase
MSEQDKTSDSRADIREHLKLYQELGVAGVSRDPAWRQRADAEPHDPQNSEPAAAERGEPAPTVSTAQSAPAPDAFLSELRAYIGHDCARCKLGGLGRRQVVFGSGNPHAALMFVGEAPGADEDAQGVPFVGRAGQLLTKIIEAIDLKREDVYIANVIKCRPPGNRAPERDEVETCEPFLMQQIDAIRPKVIVALGTHAAHALLKTDAPISRIRGHVHEFRPSTGANSSGAADDRPAIKLVPTFHPAFLLRSPDRKRDVWEDMKKVKALLAGD